jgi:hypothetical protein
MKVFTIRSLFLATFFIGLNSTTILAAELNQNIEKYLNNSDNEQINLDSLKTSHIKEFNDVVNSIVQRSMFSPFPSAEFNQVIVFIDGSHTVISMTEFKDGLYATGYLSEKQVDEIWSFVLKNTNVPTEN